MLARPDSVLVHVGDGARRRERLAGWVGSWDRDQAELIAEPGPARRLRFETIRFPAGHFNLILRMYWPRAAALDGNWAPPPVARVD